MIGVVKIDFAAILQDQEYTKYPPAGLEIVQDLASIRLFDTPDTLARPTCQGRQLALMCWGPPPQHTISG